MSDLSTAFLFSILTLIYSPSWHGQTIRFLSALGAPDSHQTGGARPTEHEEEKLSSRNSAKVQACIRSDRRTISMGNSLLLAERGRMVRVES